MQYLRITSSELQFAIPSHIVVRAAYTYHIIGTFYTLQYCCT